MKFLTIFDYTNIFALFVSTLIVIAVQFLGWGSSMLTVIMLLLLVIVIIGSVVNRKYRKMARKEEHVVITQRDHMIARTLIGAVIILAVLSIFFTK